jgi:hypothetical protein
MKTVTEGTTDCVFRLEARCLIVFAELYSARANFVGHKADTIECAKATLPWTLG